jgi:hypothetical protein
LELWDNNISAKEAMNMKEGKKKGGDSNPTNAGVD